MPSQRSRMRTSRSRRFSSGAVNRTCPRAKRRRGWRFARSRRPDGCKSGSSAPRRQVAPCSPGTRAAPANRARRSAHPGSALPDSMASANARPTFAYCPLERTLSFALRVEQELLGEVEIAVEIAGRLKAGGEPADLLDGHPVVEFGAFRDIADALRLIRRHASRRRGRGFWRSRCRAGVRPLRMRMVVDLPAPLSPKQREDRPGRHAQAERIKGLFAGIGLGYLVKLDGWVHESAS